MRNKTRSNEKPSRTVPTEFLAKLGEMRTAEMELTAALPLIVASAKSDDLAALLHIHLRETAGHARMVEDLGRYLGRHVPARRCPQMTTLIAKGVKAIGKRVVSHEQDHALITVGREIEQFEMKSYRELCSIARQNGLTHAVAVLSSILQQEELANQLLGELDAGENGLERLVQNASMQRAGVRQRPAA